MNTINQFTAKKLGEVHAFAKAGIDTFERGRPALLEIFSKDELDRTVKEFHTHFETIEEIAKEAGVLETVLTKSEGTQTKLTSMRDAYVGDEWHNPAELLEWLGFFEGSALVHWSLALGASEALEERRLEDLCRLALELHETMLGSVVASIRKYAYEKAPA
jgi:hypothetical protein